MCEMVLCVTLWSVIKIKNKRRDANAAWLQQVSPSNIWCSKIYVQVLGLPLVLALLLRVRELSSVPTPWLGL